MPIDEVNAAFPQLSVVAVSNQGNFIERSIQNVSNSVLYGGGFAILVLLFFLRSGANYDKALADLKRETAYKNGNYVRILAVSAHGTAIRGIAYRCH